MRITEQDYKDISLQEGIGIAELKTIMEVESAGVGHLKDGKPKILFEGHKFYQHLAKSPALREKLMEERPDLCYRSWTSKFYKGGAAEWIRLDAAIGYDREAALKSASWGAFQIMGEHYASIGFASVQDFVNAMFKGERHHLVAVCKFIKCSKVMHKALITRDWASFARLYNGPLYKKNQYDVKLASAFRKYSKA